MSEQTPDSVANVQTDRSQGGLSDSDSALLERSSAGSSPLFGSRLACVVDQDRDLYAVGDVELVEQP